MFRGTIFKFAKLDDYVICSNFRQNFFSFTCQTTILFHRYDHFRKSAQRRSLEQTPAAAAPPTQAPSPAGFRCDGRTHCSQMTSCAEATWFINHCPGTQMDGNHDGIPCEQQWCTGPGAR